MHSQKPSLITTIEAARNATLEGFNEYAYQAKMSLDTRRPLLIAINLLKAAPSEAHWCCLRDAIDNIPLERKTEMLRMADFLKTHAHAGVACYQAELKEIFNPKTYRTFSFLGIIKRDRKHSKLFQIFNPLMNRLYEPARTAITLVNSTGPEAALPPAPISTASIEAISGRTPSDIDRASVQTDHSLAAKPLRKDAPPPINPKAQKSAPPHMRTRSRRDAHLKEKVDRLRMKGSQVPLPTQAAFAAAGSVSALTRRVPPPELPDSPAGSLQFKDTPVSIYMTPSRTELESPPTLAVSGLAENNPKDRSSEAKVEGSALATPTAV